MELYAGLDLHSRNTYIGIMDDALNRVFKKRVSNDLDQILQTLTPFQDRLKGFVVESTFNWYWLVDGLVGAGYSGAHLANPAAIKQYEGLKYSDDQHDAFFLAKLLILGILPEGYIYPKEHRPVRDLARKRMFLVRHKTANILSLQSFLQRCCAFKLSANDTRKLTVETLEEWLKEAYLVLTAQASLDTITFLKEKIKCLEGDPLVLVMNNTASLFQSDVFRPLQRTPKPGTFHGFRYPKMANYFLAQPYWSVE